METQNLWPDFETETEKSPKSILKEQAGYLMAKTKNVLSAEVVSTSTNGDITHYFYIVAPALNNYRYKIFHVTQDVVSYPLFVVDENEELSSHYPDKADNEEQFLKILGKIFNNIYTKRVITSLISQSLQE